MIYKEIYKDMRVWTVEYIICARNDIYKIVSDRMGTHNEEKELTFTIYKMESGYPPELLHKQRGKCDTAQDAQILLHEYLNNKWGFKTPKISK